MEKCGDYHVPFCIYERNGQCQKGKDCPWLHQAEVTLNSKGKSKDKAKAKAKPKGDSAQRSGIETPDDGITFPLRAEYGRQNHTTPTTNERVDIFFHV